MNRRSPRGEPAIRSPDTGGTSSMPAGGTTGERPGSNKKSGTKSPTRFRTRSAPRPPRSRPSSPTCTRRCPTTCVIIGTPSSPPAGDLDGALEAFEHAVGLEPTRASTYFNLARIAARMGDKSKVIEHFARAVELQPDLRDRLDEDPDLRPFKDDPDMLGRLPGGTPTGDPYAEYYATRS